MYMLQKGSPRSCIVLYSLLQLLFWDSHSLFPFFCDNDIFEDCSPVILKNVLNLDLSFFFSKLDSGCSVVQEYKSDVFISVHLMRMHMGSISHYNGINVDHLVKGGICLVVKYISWPLQYSVELHSRVGALPCSWP